MRGLRSAIRELGPGLLLGGLMMLPSSSPLCAQAGSDAEEEGRLLRSAAILESRGELEEAAELLGSHLRRNPAATGTLFALERIRRAQGRLEEVLPAVDAYLEVEPTAAGVRYLELRLLAEMDSLRELEEAAEEWIAVAPTEPEPYREVARIYGRALGSERALDILRRGSEAVEEPGSLALETGDLLMEAGRVEEGARAWARGVGADGQGGAAVLRRLERLSDDRSGAVHALLDALGAEHATAGRLRMGALIALEAGLEERALELAREALVGLDDAAARGFLLELARRGSPASGRRDRGGRVTVWAYRAVRDRTSDPEEALALDRRIADAAAQTGDTATAAEARRRVAGALPPGSAERRAALASVIRLEARGDDSREELEALLATFRAEYPDAPQTDELTATLAARLLAEGDREGAIRVLEDTDGPKSSLERAYLHLDGGEVERGREALLRAIPGLPPARATGLVELVGLLGSVGSDAARRAGRAAALAHRGRPAEGLELIVDLDDVNREDRPPLLALGAGLAAEAGDADGAARLRERLVTGFPDAAEWPGAALALARHLADLPGRRDEAVRILEGLILERPESAVVPAARRELERLRSRGGESS